MDGTQAGDDDAMMACQQQVYTNKACVWWQQKGVLLLRSYPCPQGMHRGSSLTAAHRGKKVQSLVHQVQEMTAGLRIQIRMQPAPDDVFERTTALVEDGAVHEGCRAARDHT